MKRFGWQSLVASSVILATLAHAETRPQYGGTLRVAIHGAPTSLDPADSTQPDSFARRNLGALVFETLVTVDPGGRVHPALAGSWQSASGNQRWQFRLRRGVKFDDGTPLTAEIAAASLRTANPAWIVLVEGDSVIVETGAPAPDLAAELALPHNAIVKRNGGGKLSGTGAFHIQEWQPGKRLLLAAEENYWRGRAFVDAIDIEMGRNFHDQLVSLELGRVDLIEAAPEQAHRVAMEGRQVNSSQPMELVALVFARDAQSPEEKLLRRALAMSVDRTSIRNVLLQGAGQPAASILPNWMSGYGFVFRTDADAAQANRIREQVHALPAWTVGYDANDAVARVLADRIALNAHDAGLTLQPTAAAGADLRLVRIPLASADPWIALSGVAGAAGVTLPKASGNSVEDLYSLEQSVLTTQRIIPLFHLPVSYVASPALQDCVPAADGSLRLADVWLRNDKP